MKKPNPFLLLSAFFLGFFTPAHAATEPVAPPESPAPATPPAATAPASSSAIPSTPVPLALTPASVLNQSGLYNLARWYAGSGLVVMQPDGEPKTLTLADHDQSPFSPLLDQDGSVATPIGAGDTRIVIDLGDIKLIKRVGFFSFTENGTVDIYYTNSRTDLSPTSTRWLLTNARAPIAPGVPVDITLQPLSARYIMLAFNSTAAGSIGSLAIFAQRPMVGHATAPEQPGVNGVPAVAAASNRAIDFDFGPSAFGSRVTHVAGGNVSQAQNALDGDPKTATVLGESAHSDNIMIVDLGATREVNKLGLLFGSQGPGNLEFYMVDDLPASLKKPAPGSTPASAPASAPAPAAASKPTAFVQRPQPAFLLASTAGSLGEALALAQLAQADAAVQLAYLPPDFFTNYKPIFIKHVNGDEQRLSEKFDKLPCRYLIIRWVPDNPNNQALSLFEVNLIGPVPEAGYNAAATEYQFSSAASTGGSGSNGGGTAAGGGSGGSAGGGNGGGGGTGPGGGGGGEGPGPPPPVSP